MVQCKTKKFGDVHVDFNHVKPSKGQGSDPFDQRVKCCTIGDGKLAGYVAFRDLPWEAIPLLVKRQHGLSN